MKQKGNDKGRTLGTSERNKAEQKSTHTGGTCFSHEWWKSYHEVKTEITKAFGILGDFI